MNDIYQNTDKYNLNKKHKILIVSDHMIADLLSYKILYPIVSEMFIRSRKTNISLVFSTHVLCYQNY